MTLLPYVDWVKQKGFYIRDTWDDEASEWSGKPGPLVLRPHQERVLSHALTPVDGKLPYSTVVFSCPKKSGKTTIAGSVGAWFADELDGIEIYNIANDLDKTAGIVMGDMQYHVRYQPERYPRSAVTKAKIVHPNDTVLQSLAQNYRSVAGARQSLTLWDELWGYTSELSIRTYDEMTPIPTVKHSIRFVVTYAGFLGESELLWDLYLRGVGTDEHEDGQGERIPGLEDLPCWRNGKTFIYWDHQGRMPWQTKEYYDEQMGELRAAAFLRLHRNQWVTTHERFIPDGWWKQAESRYEQSAMIWKEHPYRMWPVYIGVDVGIKHDSSAIVGVTYDADKGKVIVLFHKIFTPMPGVRFDLEETIEDYILNIIRPKFNVVQIACDPTHIHQTMNRIARKGLNVVEYPQTVGNMTLVSQQLYDLLKGRNLWGYPASDLGEHIRDAVAEDKGRGFRIVKRKSSAGGNHIDGAIATAQACYAAINGGGASFGKRVRLESPFSDSSTMKHHDPINEQLPFALRS